MSRKSKDDDLERDDIEEVLLSELGSHARCSRLTDEHRTPMTLILDEARKHLADKFSVYWVEEGYPEVFCLDGFSNIPVVFNTRYLSLSVFIRKLFTSQAFESLIPDITYRAALQLTGELALRRGDPDLAVLAFVQNTIDKGFTISWGANESADVMVLENEPINEGYMATWFYGLLHELGHLRMRDISSDPEMLLSDETILEILTWVIDEQSFPKELKKEALARSRNKKSNSVISINQLRSEGLADMFACSILLRTTFEIMREAGERKFQVEQFVCETIIFHNIIAFFDRCRRVSSIASATKVEPDVLIENLLQPVAVAARNSIQRIYLDQAVTKYLYGSQPSEDDAKRVVAAINKLTSGFRPVIEKVDKGLAQAMEFLLYPERRENDWTILEKFRKEYKKNVMTRMETDRFLEIADALGKTSKLLTAVKEIRLHPEKSVTPDPTGDLIYFVPWITGPNNVDRPFGLDTKHGHVIFVFLDKDDLYNEFCDISAELLVQGIQLSDAVVPVPRQQQVGRELVRFMPAIKFQVVIQGTERFDAYMKELVDDTIW